MHCGWGFTGLESGVLMIRKKVWNALSDEIRPRVWWRENDRIIGAILCGHDGRRGCLYHVCVHEDYRKQGIGQKMVEACLAALKREHVNKVNLIAFKKNDIGNHFWQGMGWTFREDVNYYEYVTNEENQTVFNP